MRGTTLRGTNLGKEQEDCDVLEGRKQGWVMGAEEAGVQ